MAKIEMKFCTYCGRNLSDALDEYPYMPYYSNRHIDYYAVRTKAGIDHVCVKCYEALKERMIQSGEWKNENRISKR